MLSCHEPISAVLSKLTRLVTTRAQPVPELFTNLNNPTSHGLLGNAVAIDGNQGTTDMPGEVLLYNLVPKSSTLRIALVEVLVFASTIWKRRFPQKCVGITTATMLLVLVASASAAPVTGWNLDTSLNGSASLTGVMTNSPMLGDGTVDNANNTAIWASIPGTVLADGRGIRLTGQVAISGAQLRGNAFRWGFYRELGAGPPDTTSGWLGYSPGNSTLSLSGRIFERNPDGVDFSNSSFASLAGNLALSIAESVDPWERAFVDGTYEFDLLISRRGNNLDISASLTGDDFSNSWMVRDSTPAAGLNAIINRVGLVAGDRFLADQLQFSNIDVTVMENPPILNCSVTMDCVVEQIADNGQGITMPYQLLLPPGHDQPDAKFPLILYLHGSGGPGIFSGLIDSTQSEEFPSFVLAPQIVGSWSPQNPQDLTLDILKEVIEKYAIDERRIYITGISSGGFGTTTYVLSDEFQFAAAVPMSGASSISLSEAEKIKDVPFWLFHGGDDAVVGPEVSRKFVAALEQVGGSPRYDELAGQGHNIWNPIYTDWQTDTYDLYPWLFSNSLPVPEPTGFLLALLATALVGSVLRKGR